MNPFFTNNLKKSAGMTLVGALLCIALAALILVGSLRYYEARKAKERLTLIQLDVTHLLNDASRYFLQHCQRNTDDNPISLTLTSDDLIPCFIDSQKCENHSQHNLDTLAPTKRAPWVDAYHVYLVPMAITNAKNTDPTPTGEAKTTMYHVQVMADLPSNITESSNYCLATAQALAGAIDHDPKTAHGCTIVWDELPGMAHQHNNKLWGMEVSRLQWQRTGDAALSNSESVCSNG